MKLYKYIILTALVGVLTLNAKVLRIEADTTYTPGVESPLLKSD